MFVSTLGFLMAVLVFVVGLALLFFCIWLVVAVIDGISEFFDALGRWIADKAKTWTPIAMRAVMRGMRAVMRGMRKLRQ